MTKQEKAIQLHQNGYNCAQAVVCAYCEEFGLDEQTAFKMSEALGLGMGRKDTCGALTGALLLAGMRSSAGIEAAGTSKQQTYALAREMGQAFIDKNETLVCCELRGEVDGRVRRSCDGCIEDSCALLERMVLGRS